VGTVCGVLSVEVYDTFGTSHTLESFAKIDAMGGAERPWRFFELSGDSRPENGEPPLMFLAPALTARHESDDLELVSLVRDEGANMGWAVERFIEHASGRRIDRRQLWENNRPEVPPPTEEVWRFKVATSVPDYWIPLVPVRILDDVNNAQPTIGLMRGRMPTGVDVSGDVQATIARGQVLKPGQPLVLQESQVPRSGISINRRYQLARGSDGRVFLWMGQQKVLGREPENSGLVFDTIEREESGDGGAS